MKDNFGRTVNYLRFSVTDLCNYRCRYCMPQEGIRQLEHRDILSFEEIERLVRCFASLGIDKIRLTGGEPLVRNGIVSLVNRIAGIPGIRDIAMTTNGVLLPDMAVALKKAGLKRVNISIDSLNPEKYREMSRGGSLSDVLAGIAAVEKAGLSPIRLNVVLIGGFNDNEIEDFAAMTAEREMDVRFIELMPLGETAEWSKENFVTSNCVLERLPALLPLDNEDPASPARYYKLPGSKGRIGLISPVSCQFCGSCNRIRMTAEGKLKYCLHSDREIPLGSMLRQGASNEKLTRLITSALKEKPLSHAIKEGKFVRRNMIQVGG